MFLENKYTKWYYSIINEAKKSNRIKKDGAYYESHHIIPRCLGGIEEVLLTAKEHFICHLLLCRMTTGSNKHKMINALIKMAYANGKGQERYSSRSFSLIRTLIAEKNREMFRGKKKSEKTRNNMKGRSGKWIRTEEYKQTLKGPGNPWYGKTGDLNVSKRTDVREKISASKKGRKRIYREDGTYYYEKRI